MLTAVEMRNAEFYRSARGYKVEEVDEFIERAAQTVETLQRENSDLMRKLEVLADKIEEYRKDEDSIRSALLTAQRMGDQIVRDAKENAETQKSEAEQKAKEIVGAAKQKADELMSETERKSLELVRETRERATAVIAEAKDRSGRMILESLDNSRKEKAALDKLKTEAADFRMNLLAMYKAQIELINQIPSEVPAPRQEQPLEEPAQQEEHFEALDGFLNELEEESKEPAQEAMDEVQPDAEMEESPVEEAEQPSAEERPEPEEDDDELELIGVTPAAHGNGQTAKKTGGFHVKLDEEEEMRPSKFTNLKFGEGYDIELDDEDDDEQEAEHGFFKKRKK